LRMVVHSDVLTLVLVAENGSEKNEREHHVDHMSLSKSNPAYNDILINLVLQITMGFCKW
jgi:hypothetical protein